MSEQTPSRGRRLILDLCQCAADAQTIQAAAEFARLLRLDLHCLFIEDEALLSFAALPFAREIRLPTFQWSPLQVDTISAELQEAAQRTRRMVEAIVRDLQVASGFEIVRGDPATCIAAVCQSGDVIIVAEPAAPAARTAYGLRRLHVAAHGSGVSIMLIPAGGRAGQGDVVAVLADERDDCLDVACRIAVADDAGLSVVIPRQFDQAARARVRERAVALGVRAERIALHAAAGRAADELLTGLAHVRERLIVIGRDPQRPADVVARLAAARGVPVLVIESGAGTEQSVAAHQDEVGAA
jgi:hypothetical protein